MLATEPQKIAFQEANFFFDRACEVYCKYMEAVTRWDVEGARELEKQHKFYRHMHDKARNDFRRLNATP